MAHFEGTSHITLRKNDSKIEIEGDKDENTIEKMKKDDINNIEDLPV